MADFDYGNARLRAMKSRLLARGELETLAEVGSLQGLISALAKTAYQKSIEAALTQASGLECIAQAIRMDLINICGKVRNFFRDDAGRMVSIALRPYDLHNIKAILRGLSRNVPSAEILSALLPVGEVNYAVLAELARLPGPRAAIDLLASMNEPIAQPLLKLRARHPGADLPEMELALDQWHYQEAWNFIQTAPSANEVLASALKLEADIVNLLSVLRFAHEPDERRRLHERGGAGELVELLVEPGFVSHALLVHVGNQDSLEAAVEALVGTRYAPALTAGLGAFMQTGRLSDIEKHLKRFRLNWLSNLIFKDPLGIGVFLGYLALKVNEINNLRWITHAIHLGLGPREIKAELEFAG